MPNSHPARIMFFASLVSGLLIAISSNSWFTSWMGLELNLLSFIPIMTSKTNSYSSEAALKYFLVQALSSSIMLISASSMIMWKESPTLLILTSLLLKMGAAPLHFWFPTIMQGLSWMQCLTLMTIQKVAPMIMVSYTLTQLNSHWMLILASMSSSIVGSLGGLNQTLLRKILAYSSINHMAWMLAAISLSADAWTIYITTYSVVTLSLVTILNFNQSFHFKQLSLISHPPSKMLCFFTLFSLGGLPPLLGFLPKLLVIKLLIYSQSFTWLLPLIAGTLITLFYYIRLTMISMVLITPQLKTTLYKLEKKNLLLILPSINFSPLLFPMITMTIY
uniref:NADH-ubiquinone oxidoreductase chain 2 n=1 Tax=Synalpheus microneptunus TaxID=1503767 RepID=A0A6H0DU57_9EUCA|nr:NADH dehydrogenase subunit 2 [Synalpheus microneptunus]QIS92015.1 NADH dehydrogenase subunit 2 [Synalpheus microneptunus]